MSIPSQPLSEITREAVALLVRELGISRTLRFLGQYRVAHGDYTADRRAYLGDPSIDELFEEAHRLDEKMNA